RRMSIPSATSYSMISSKPAAWRSSSSLRDSTKFGRGATAKATRGTPMANSMKAYSSRGVRTPPDDAFARQLWTTNLSSERRINMKPRMLWYLGLPPVLFGLLSMPGLATQEKVDSREGAAIQKLAEAFIKAYESGDAKAMAAVWAEDGEYT